MSWEERLLFLMYLDYKGVLKKWERNHNRCMSRHSKIDEDDFKSNQGFTWSFSAEGDSYWSKIVNEWNSGSHFCLIVPSCRYAIRYSIKTDHLIVARQAITKKDALKIVDFIYECFGEEV